MMKIMQIKRAIWSAEMAARWGWKKLVSSRVVSVAGLGALLVAMTVAGQPSKADVVTNGTGSAGVNPPNAPFFLRFNAPITPADKAFEISNISFGYTKNKDTFTASLFTSTNGTTVGAAVRTFTGSMNGTAGPQSFNTGWTGVDYSGVQYFILQLDSTGNNNRFDGLTNNPGWTAPSSGIANGSPFFTTTVNGGTALAANAKVAAFSITVSAVPEPGTLALGSFAALSGVGGWWTRRKKAKKETAQGGISA